VIRGIPTRGAFGELRSTGTWRRSGPVRCLGVLDPSIEPPEVAISIRRSFGSAVRRNRLRRQVRHAVTDLHRLEVVPSGRFLLVMPSVPTVGCHDSTVLSSLFEQFSATFPRSHSAPGDNSTIPRISDHLQP